MKKTIEVKRQTQEGSKNWGIYVDGKLVEGGFFYITDAREAAKAWAQELENQE